MEIFYVLLLAFGILIGGDEPSVSMTGYSMTVTINYEHITLQDAAGVETALREWFPGGVIQVKLVPLVPDTARTSCP